MCIQILPLIWSNFKIVFFFKFQIYLQSSRTLLTLAGQSQLLELGLKKSPGEQGRLTPRPAPVHCRNTVQSPWTATTWPAAVHLPGSGLGGVGRGPCVGRGPLVGLGPGPLVTSGLGGSTGTLPLKRTSTMAVRRGYLPSPQKEPLKSSRSKAQIIPPARPLSLMYWALMPIVLVSS